jgi:hypothetical protein
MSDTKSTGTAVNPVDVAAKDVQDRVHLSPVDAPAAVPATPDEYAALWKTSVRAHDAGRARTVQTESGIIGISDLGGCKEKVRRKILGLPHSNSLDNTSAVVGTWIHEGALNARKALFPELLIEQELHVTLPNGARVLGHADEIDPSEPSVTDLKTVDGLAHVRRHGSTEHQKWQRAMYYKAAAEAGLVPVEGMTRNIWLDRSGKDSSVVVEQEPYNSHYVNEASAWLDDVLYAVQHNEEASKDQPVPWCMSFCEYAKDCRMGALAAGGPIADPYVAETAVAFREVKDRHEADAAYLEAAKDVLRGHEGSAGDVNVRWITVQAANPYLRLEVRRSA